jgi:drug/metabolite transporter (DMT)-like permease
MKHRAEFLMISAAMGFSLGGVGAKILREADMDAFRLTQIRTTGAAAILLTIAFLTGRKQLQIKRSELKDLIIFGVIGVAAVTSFYFFAIKYLNVAVALIIEFTAPIWIVLYLRFIKHKQISPLMWWGIGFAFGGLILISQVWGESKLSPIGVAFAFADAFALGRLLFIRRQIISRPHLLIFNDLGNWYRRNLLGAGSTLVAISNAIPF